MSAVLIREDPSPVPDESAFTDPTILVVAYRADAHLEQCLAGLDSAANVCVVDNDASSTTRAIAERAGARYHAAPRNVGFAAGVNLGLRTWWDGQRDVLLLNPDARISTAGIRGLQRRLHGEDARLAAVGPLLVGDGGEPQRADWPLPSPSQMRLEAFGLASVWRGRRFVVGAVLLLRGAALSEVGGLDERYFLYAEEADWQCAAQRAGWSVAVAESISARHAGSASSSSSETRERYFHASAELFGRKWFGPGGWSLMRIAAVVAAARRCVVGPADSRALARRTLRRYAIGPVKAAGTTAAAA